MSATRIINTWRDPYDAGFSPCRRRQAEFRSGVTVLVGCNGSGKTTMLHNVEDVLRKEKVPVLLFDNLNDGGRSNLLSYGMFHKDLGFSANSWCSSEGENISNSLGIFASSLRDFIQYGITSEKRRAEKISDERWILLDAIDSGYSVDNIVDLKEFFKVLQEDADNFGVDLYILVSANEYELANEQDCFDVVRSRYLTFKTYNSYRRFILKSREAKDLRDKKAEEKRKSNRN